MASSRKKSVFGGGSVQKACQPTGLTAEAARQRARATRAPRCACGAAEGLVLVEILELGQRDGPYTYQWYKGGTFAIGDSALVSGSTTPTLTGSSTGPAV